MNQTYTSYLKLEQILSAQNPLSEGEHDEMLFIIIHQTFELWFKQILHETKRLNEALAHNEIAAFQSCLKRILTVMKTLVQQIDIIETMTPLSFASFRDRLESSSGFQSYQFRLLEFYLGFKDPKKLENYPESSNERLELESMLRQPTLFDHFLRFLHDHHRIAIPSTVLKRDFTEIYSGHDEVENAILQLYKEDPIIGDLCERLIDWDEGIQEWRYRHVKMVERTIGFKKGTGGSLGVTYLQKSLFKPAFPDLWNVRNRF
ncbi:MAG: tryptophan 2,3-dioxygenase [Oligoflexales bacterium]|nr:tryptophan 2,3-dioxygenase [Oligoflexales bacterium]